MHIYLFELISSWTDIRDVVRPTVPVVLKDFPLWLEKRDGNCIFSVEGLDFRKYLQGKQKLNVIRKKNPKNLKSQTKSTSQWRAFKIEKNSNIVITAQAAEDLWFLCLKKAEINCHRKDTWYWDLNHLLSSLPWFLRHEPNSHKSDTENSSRWGPAQSRNRIH